MTDAHRPKEQLTPRQAHYPGCWEQHAVCARIHLRASLAEIERLRMVVKDYSRHKDYCTFKGRDEKVYDLPCNCGLFILLRDGPVP